MKIILHDYDVVWSGKSGGQDGVPFHIRINNENELQDDDGCWCPKEAVKFLQSLGIRVGKDSFYTSGYYAAGCWWSAGEKELSTHVELARRFFFGEMENKDAKSMLRKWDDD